jgi:hypothetical protein
MAYCCASWHGDGPGAIDPSEGGDAAEKRVEMGLTTLDAETAEYNGGDWQRNSRSARASTTHERRRIWCRRRSRRPGRPADATRRRTSRSAENAPPQKANTRTPAAALKQWKFETRDDGTTIATQLEDVQPARWLISHDDNGVARAAPIEPEKVAA